MTSYVICRLLGHHHLAGHDVTIRRASSRHVDIEFSKINEKPCLYINAFTIVTSTSTAQKSKWNIRYPEFKSLLRMHSLSMTLDCLDLTYWECFTTISIDLAIN